MAPSTPDDSGRIEELDKYFKSLGDDVSPVDYPQPAKAFESVRHYEWVKGTQKKQRVLVTTGKSIGTIFEKKTVKLPTLSQKRPNGAVVRQLRGASLDMIVQKDIIGDFSDGVIAFGKARCHIVVDYHVVSGATPHTSKGFDVYLLDANLSEWIPLHTGRWSGSGVPIGGKYHFADNFTLPAQDYVAVGGLLIRINGDTFYA